MYLARKKIENQTHYYIRASYADGGCYRSRDLFYLGVDPSQYIVYPGGHGYYYDEIVEETLRSDGLNPSQQDLDGIFWEFLDPEIRRVIRGFERSSTGKGTRTCEFNENAVQAVHLFDKRRTLYLKFAQVDQRHIHRASARLFAMCHDKSRDELEQSFLAQERILSSRERATYVYVIFNLQRFFSEPEVHQGPGCLHLETLDEYFVQELCRLNEDVQFWAGMPSSDRLREYLIRYAIMYFDFELPRRSARHDYIQEFMGRHRRYRPPPKIQVKMEEAARLFGVPWKALKAMKREAFTRLYRQLALKHHPDCGGDSETFIHLTAIYEHLMTKKSE
jgi:hypothetical protein